MSATTMTTKAGSLATNLSSAITLMNLLRKHLYEDAPLRMAQIFLEVASQSEISYQELERRLGVNQPVISRLAKALGKGWPERKGLGVIESWDDPHDARTKVCKLSPSGRAVLAKILADI